MKSGTTLKMGYVGSKVGHKAKSYEQPCVYPRGHIFNPILMEPGQNVCFNESWMSLQMVHISSKTKAIGQVLEKPCVCARSHIFCPILMKLGQNV